MENKDFEIAENKSWILDIKINLQNIKISSFKSIMKLFGMKYLADFTEWHMKDFDINKFQSYYLFTIQAYRDNIVYSKKTCAKISEINGFIIEYMFASVDKSVIKYFCQWLEELDKYINIRSICIFDKEIRTIHELEIWLNKAALYIEKKYYPCGTLGSEELFMCLNGTIDI